MIGKISVKDIAGHVNLPLPTVFVMQRSAACIGFLDVPAYATAVALTVVNASGTSGTFPASKVDGIWSVNLPGSFFIEPGKVEHGVILKAYDSSQAEYLIGRGDLVIESADATPSPGETVTNITDRTLEGETFDLETGDGQYGAIKQLITKLGGTVAALAVMVAAHAAPPPGFTNDVFSADGVTWTRHGSINTRSSYVVTDATIPTVTGLTTNDVCNIVTNSASPPGFTEWTMAYSSPDTRPGSHLGECYHGYWELLDGNGVSYDFAEGGEDALELTFEIAGCGFGRTYVPYVNALGLARTVDLPDVKPATQLLLTGADGKTYSIKIDENRALIIDEVNE